MKAPKVYTRLTRPVANLAFYQSLWLADDHLLLVSSTGMWESYQRFRYADMQALTVGHSDYRKIVNCLWFAFAALFFALGLPALLTSGGWGWLVPGTIFAGIGLTNHLLGPTCKVSLVTRVKTVHLPVRRRKKAALVIATLEPRIREAQSSLLTASRVSVEPPQL